MPIPADLQRELQTRGLRHALWLALLLAQQLDELELAGQLMTLVIQVDARFTAEAEA